MLTEVLKKGRALFFQSSLISGLREENWILISASVFNLLWYVVLLKAFEENTASGN